MNRARSNLALARSRIHHVYLEELCFEAQQAAEKAIKALLIRRGIEFPYIHDLSRLLLLLEEAGETIPSLVRQAEDLTDYATVMRYPARVEPVSEQEYAKAIEIETSGQEKLQCDQLSPVQFYFCGPVLALPASRCKR